MRRRTFLGSALTSLAASACATKVQNQKEVTDPLLTDAVGQAAMIAERRISPLELTRAVVERAEAINPSINAIVTETFEAALSRSRGNGLPEGPFHGVPFAIKDLADVAGVRTSMGSRAFLQNVAT